MKIWERGFIFLLILLFLGIGSYLIADTPVYKGPVILQDLTASRIVITDSAKQLSSVTYTVATPTTGGIIYGSGTGAWANLAAGTANKILQMGAALPAWSSFTVTLSGNTTLADWFDQAVKAASAVTFATVDTGQGANELYDMDQNVLTSSTPQFAGLTFSTDLILSREDAAIFQLGADAAGVTNQMIKGPDRITSDGVGGDLTIAAGRNRGVNDGGSIYFQTSPQALATVTGTLATRMTIGPTGKITIATTNDDGLVFGSLGTATKAIDLSGSGLSGADNLIYFTDNNYWSTSTLKVSSTIWAMEVIRTDLFADSNLYNELAYYSGGASGDWLLNLTSNSIKLFGNSTKVGSLTSCTRDTTTTITKAVHGLTLAVGELVHVTASTGSTDLGFYRIVSSTPGTIVVDRALTGNDSSVALTVYKDVISIHATDATNGQMLTSWSAQNKPMQIGGTVLIATANSLTSTDVVMGGMTEFMGNTYLKAGTSTGYSTPVGAINITTTGVGNVDAGEDTLMTYSLPTNALSANAKGVRVTVYGTIANNANAKTVKVYFGTTTVYTDSMTVNQAYNWTAQYTAIRTGTDTQDVFGTGFIENTAMTVAPYYATDAQDDGAAIVIKCTGEGVASNDIIQQGMLVEYIN